MRLNDRVLDLDDPRCADPSLAGAKASSLARARQRGLSVLPGLVVTAGVSLPAMRCGAETLELRGSGGARLEVGRFRLDPDLQSEVARAVSKFGSNLAVRSSSVLEGDGKWSGAFASYLDVAPSEIETAIAGCWASAFTVATLERFGAAGLQPGAAPMAVLVQPAIEPEFGGVALLDEHGNVEVLGIKGSPAPLVQGWMPGVRAVIGPGGEITSSEEALSYLPPDLIGEVAGQVRAAHRMTGANSVEWGSGSWGLSLLQLGNRQVPPISSDRRRPQIDRVTSDERLVALSRLARRFPGPLGETLVLAWAGSDPTSVIEAWDSPIVGWRGGADSVKALQEAAEEASHLTAEVWEMPAPMAAARASMILRQVRGNHPGPALDRLDGLRKPDTQRVDRVLGLLAIAQKALSPFDRPRSSVDRYRADPWEPFQASIVATFGTEHRGVSAAPGVGCGRLCFIDSPGHAEDFRPRDVVVTTIPVPNLAPLLWEAAGIVTIFGSPAAHLFDAARSLNVPAVCSVDLARTLGMHIATATGQLAMAIDGNEGLVHTHIW